MRPKSSHLIAVFAVLAFPLGVSSTERLVKMQEIEEPQSMGPPPMSSYRLTRRNQRTFVNPTSGAPSNAAKNAWRQANTAVVYTTEEVNGLLTEKDAKIAQAEAKIAQLTEMILGLAAKHDALVKRFEEAETE